MDFSERLRRAGTSPRHLAIYAVVLAAGLAMTFYPTFLSGFSRMQGGTGDSLLNNYILEHEYRVLTDETYPFSLWSPPFFYPEKNVLAYGDNLFAGEPIYAFLRPVLDPQSSFQVWTMLALVGNFFAFLYLARYLDIGPHLASFGSFLFAFGLPRTSQFDHEQLFLNMFAPLALLFAWRFLQSPSRRFAVGAAVFFFLQLLASYYLGWMLLLGEIAFASAVFALDRDARRKFASFFRRRAVFLLFLAGGCLAAVVFLFRPYKNAAKILGLRPWSAVARFLPHVWSWISVPSGSFYSRWLHPPSWATAPWEQYLFMGFIFWVAAAGSLLYLFRRSAVDRSQRIFVASAWITFLVLFIASLKIPNRIADVIPGVNALLGSEPSLWHLVYAFVPGAKAIRAVSRIWTTAYLFLLPGSLLGIDLWLRRRIQRDRFRRVLLSAILTAGMAEQWMSGREAFRKAIVFGHIHAIASELRRAQCPIGYVELDPSKPPVVSQVNAMWAGLRADVPVINGFSGNFPPKYPHPGRSMTPSEIETWLGTTETRVCIVPVPR